MIFIPTYYGEPTFVDWVNVSKDWSNMSFMPVICKSSTRVTAHTRAVVINDNLNFGVCTLSKGYTKLHPMTNKTVKKAYLLEGAIEKLSQLGIGEIKREFVYGNDFPIFSSSGDPNRTSSYTYSLVGAIPKPDMLKFNEENNLTKDLTCHIGKARIRTIKEFANLVVGGKVTPRYTKAFKDTECFKELLVEIELITGRPLRC